MQPPNPLGMKIFLVVMFIAASCQGGEPAKDFTVPGFIKPASNEHPRLFFRAAGREGEGVGSGADRNQEQADDMAHGEEIRPVARTVAWSSTKRCTAQIDG